MKQRTYVDAFGNTNIQQWADEDYPEEYANEDSMHEFLAESYAQLRTFLATPNNQINNVALVGVVKIIARCLIRLIRLYRRDLDGVE